MMTRRGPHIWGSCSGETCTVWCSCPRCDTDWWQRRRRCRFLFLFAFPFHSLQLGETCRWFTRRRHHRRSGTNRRWVCCVGLGRWRRRCSFRFRLGRWLWCSRRLAATGLLSFPFYSADREDCQVSLHTEISTHHKNTHTYTLHTEISTPHQNTHTHTTHMQTCTHTPTSKGTNIRHRTQAKTRQTYSKHDPEP